MSDNGTLKDSGSLNDSGSLSDDGSLSADRPVGDDRRTAGRSAEGRVHEQALAETFVTLADTLVDDYDIVDLLDRLVTACVDLLDVSAAGILLNDLNGTLTVVASSSEDTRLLEVFQLQGNQGPCLDCVRSGQAVTSGDLEANRDRWPQFVPAALGVGFRSVAAVPLRLRKETIGGLNMFDARARTVSLSDRRLAQALADVATIGILQRRSTSHHTLVAEQLQHALDSRIIIEQAKGVLSERSGMSMDAAFDAVRKHSRNNNLKLTDVAAGVVAGRLELGPVHS